MSTPVTDPFAGLLDAAVFEDKAKVASRYDGPIHPNVTKLVTSLNESGKAAVLPVASLAARDDLYDQLLAAARLIGKVASVKDRFENKDTPENVTHIRITIGEKRGQKPKTAVPAVTTTPDAPRPATPSPAPKKG